MNRQRLITSLLLAGLMLLGAVNVFFIFSGWSQIHPRLSHYKQRIMETDPVLTKALDNIASHVQSRRYVNESEKLDYIRNWVNQNSLRKVDEEHERYASKTHVVVPMLWRRHMLREDPPHLACGSRTYAMKLILAKLGIKSRVIDVFKNASNGGGELESHTFLEVWNEQTRSWEIQDPDLNVSFQHVMSAKRVSVFQMVMENIDEMEPIDRNGPMRWPGERSFFNVAAYRLHYEGDRSVVIMNSGRLVRVSRPGSGDANREMMKYFKDRYYDPIIFDGHGLARP